MPKVEAFELTGYELTIRLKDHPPPHFHVIKENEWDIRVMFNLSRIQGTIIWTAKYPKSMIACPLTGTEQRQLVGLVTEHKNALNKQWAAQQ